ncbi:flagellar basal body-associated protein FliL [Nocardioides caeni]|uniref:Flagellar protein FliL n=1 Tax=Nocardioides caeni TaxID=574700 RepID=A0A4S8NIA4_9ACTN|nr:flagellar basal body-associated FliL family protein [Nocardioides caeni]THV14714.1 flagellar basal body-associated FliL family protein [Nocardioides caeni]
MSTATAAPPDKGAADAKSSKVRTIGIAVLVLGLAAGAAWYFMLRPSGETEPKPGEVVALEPIQVNLAGGHYLRLGMALQLVEGAHEVDGSKALDAAITVFSGRPVGEVNKAESREHLRHELNEVLHERYHDEVMEVLFTEFVTQ